VGFEPTIPVFERAKTSHALDCATTVIVIYADGLHKLLIYNEKCFRENRNFDFGFGSKFPVFQRQRVTDKFLNIEHE
jgi:hypothetical protein